MPPLYHFFRHLKDYKLSYKQLWVGSLMIFFWSIYDGIVTYITPLVITRHDFSASVMGIIVGTSSVTGAVFDILLSRFLKNTYYRRIYMIMLALCCLFPLLLWQANTIWMFLLAMCVWGIYFDLYNWGTFDFVSRTTNKTEHASGFGIVEIFHALGYFLAPILAGLVIAEVIDVKPFILLWIIIGMCIACFFVLTRIRKNHKTDEPVQVGYKRRSFIGEFRTWKKIGKVILPVLVFTLLLNITQAFFWTIGPLYAESLSELHPFGSMLIVAYSFPQLLVGLVVGKVTKKYGKKRSAFLSFMVGGAIMMAFLFTANVFLVLGITIVSSIFLAFSWPAINAAYVDYISEAENFERQIEGIGDFFTNMGYIIGPIMAGICYDLFGGKTFGILGGAIVVVTIILLKVTPKHITIPTR